MAQLQLLLLTILHLMPLEGLRRGPQQAEVADNVWPLLISTKVCQYLRATFFLWVLAAMTKLSNSRDKLLMTQLGLIQCRVVTIMCKCIHVDHNYVYAYYSSVRMSCN